MTPEIKSASKGGTKQPSFPPVTSGLLQRKCACGGSPGVSGECESCQGKRLQRKLTIGSSNDPLEIEADRVADQVMADSGRSVISGVPPRIQRFSGQTTGQVIDAPASVEQVLSSSGSPLESSVREDMEQRFGYDFSRVRIHSDSAANRSARDVNAAAYTVGQSIVFAAGRFGTGTTKERRLLAHELAHTAQQRDCEKQSTPRTPPIPLMRQNDDINERRTQELTEKLSTLHEMHAYAEPELDYWERTARQVFRAANYDAYCRSLKSAIFFGNTIASVHDDLADKLRVAENDLRTRKGSNYQPPHADSALRKKKGMHGWGMAVDFDVLKNPYVLNESGEKALDRDLVKVYDHIASFMLGKNASDLTKLKGGRTAFGGSIATVYDTLHEESAAMKRYFALLDNDDAIKAFLTNDWPSTHPGQQTPEIAEIRARIRDDYEILGGATTSGGKRPTGDKGDRPFAPTSSNFRGDPATGFLNLDKDFVEALTAAGLAWGAVDIAGEPGDIQHFDLRLSGIGKRVYELMLK